MKKLLILAFSFFAASSAFADCAKGNVYEDLACYEVKIKKDKVTLNKVYNELYNSLDGEGKKQLEVSQKAWLNYRHTQCDNLMGYFGSQAQGAGSALIQQSCVSEKISDRIEELKSLAD